MCCTIQSGTTAISSESGSALGLFCQMFVREVEQQKSDWQKQSSCKTFLPILSVSFQKLFTAILFSPLVYLFRRHSREFNFPQKSHLSCMLSKSQQAKKRGEPFFTKLMHDFQATMRKVWCGRWKSISKLSTHAACSVWNPTFSPSLFSPWP